ncbi:acyltransferase family protein [Blastococcus xanthinilyticus]|uniref:Peptidoglycan/LPS O-acetylase OafA/YrhL n=1 Tax=Blastococcus xanthinilyticus TaxID=1564164 RepID=A0A5S5D3U5_9ACTN|nr:acyltransferase [Blastococcus xanthinilyticus]TYP89846.1 peptidoglycan/LPS O-acetylase OafA/YrhL [Blastococcus xanthinilyticus]
MTHRSELVDRPAVDAPRSARPEIRALTGLRLVAALWVVAHHFWLFAPDRSWLVHLEPLRPLLEAGWLGVDLFFVLSGFVLAHTYVAVLGRRPGLRATADFYWARLARIWPTWMVVLTAVSAGLVVQELVTGQPGRATAAGFDAGAVLRQVLLVQVWDQPGYAATGPVGPGWSLSAEWLAYLVFPALVLVLFRLRRCRPVVLGALALAAVTPFAWTCVVLGAHDWRWSWALRLAGCFLAGALVALCVARIRGSRVLARRAAVVATGAAAAVPLAVLVAGDGRGGVAVLAFPVLVGALALAEGGPARLLSAAPVVLGGRISFALYLVHMAVFETCWTLGEVVPALGGGSPAGAVLQAVVPVLPLPAAWLLWRCVEEPARRRMRGALPAPAPRLAPPAATPEAPRARVDAPVPVHA